MYNESDMSELVMGSRGSQLALQQAGQVIDMILRGNPGLSCRTEVIKTTGDAVADVPLSAIGDKGLFVKEIELALIGGEIDFAVHSAKDVPSTMPDELFVVAYPEREDPRDALVSKVGGLSDMHSGARVGTSSVRRGAQLLHVRPDLSIVDLRGNLDTRLRKLDNSVYDAVVLACAGLRRMGWESRITEALPVEVCIPAAGQGALAVQCRKDSPGALFLSKLDHAPTRRCVTAERELLSHLDAGCQTPVGALASEVNGALELRAVVVSVDGSEIVRGYGVGDREEPRELGRRVAAQLLASDAGRLLEEARRSAGTKSMGAA